MPLRISRRFTSGGSRAARTVQLQPLAEAPQLGARVYQSLLSGIISGTIEPVASLRPDAIAEQLNVSTTPVREALVMLESDRLAINRPYQGWFVRDFSEPDVRGMYELRASLECLAVRLACQRITKEELPNLRSLQARGVGGSAGLGRYGCLSYLQSGLACKHRGLGAQFLSLYRHAAAEPAESNARRENHPGGGQAFSGHFGT